MMTKKDYKAIAKAIRGSRFQRNLIRRDWLVDNLVVYLCTVNPAFDAGKFRDACNDDDAANPV